MTRAADADQWIDRRSFVEGDPEQRRRTAGGRAADRPGCARQDGVKGKPAKTERVEQPVVYGPDLLDRWKGRAFQQSPDSSISLVGFEHEQVNWEANAALLGWRSGPVRLSARCGAPTRAPTSPRPRPTTATPTSTATACA